MDAESDDAIIVRCRDGAPEAFRILVERHGDVVYRTLCLMTRDHALAEDLTQEALIHAWRGLAGFRLGSPFRPWLLRIAANRAISHRRRRMLTLVPLFEATGRPASQESTPETRVEEAADQDQVRRALAQLPNDQRQALVLRYYADLSVPEIAQATGWREGTVKSRLHRALNHMRSILEPQLQEWE